MKSSGENRAVEGKIGYLMELAKLVNPLIRGSVSHWVSPQSGTV